MPDTNQEKRVKLIFNPASGEKGRSPAEFISITQGLQSLGITPEVYLTEPNTDVSDAVHGALEQDMDMFVVCGGDGTVSAVAKAIAGTSALLGIIPTGTYNNIALSLGIPSDTEKAVALLRGGRIIEVDMGLITCEGKETPFFEVCSVGLLTKLFPSSDEIIHGNILKLGEFLSTLTFSEPSNIQLILDGKQEIKLSGHAVLITNMPYVSRNYHVGEQDCFEDGLLDIHLFADMTKTDMVGYIIKGAGADTANDPRMQHFKASYVEIHTNPPMPVMADGVPLGEGYIGVRSVSRSLRVITGLDKIFMSDRKIHEEQTV